MIQRRKIAEYSRILNIFILIFLLTFFFNFIILPVYAANQSEITAGVARNLPPDYSIDNKTGKPVGFAIDIMNIVAKNAGLKVRYIIFDKWPQAVQELREGRIDVIPDLAITEDRRGSINFTSPLETFNISIFVRTTTTDIRGIDDLKGRNVGVVFENIGFNITQKYKANTIIFNSSDEALMSLLSGNTDALVYPDIPITFLARNSGLYDHIKTVGPPLLEVKRAIAVRKDNTELLNRLDNEVKKLVASHEYEQIYAEWYGEEDVYWSPMRIMVVGSIILTILIIYFLSWHYFSLIRLNKHLRRSIEKQKTVEADLRESEARYRSLFDNMLEGFARCRMLFEENVPVNFTYLEVNAAFENLTGLKNVVGKKVTEIIPDIKRTNPEIFEIYGRVTKTGKPERLEVYLNSIGWLRISVYSMQDETFVAVFDNITQSKRIEDELKKASAYNRNLIEASLDPLVTIDKDGKITDVNNATENVTGYSREKLIGTDFYNYFTEPEKAREGYKQVFEKGFVRDFSLAIQHISGEVTEVLYNATVYKSETGEVQGIFAAARDITHRRQMEAALRDSEERYRTVVELSNDAIYILDTEGRFVYANKRAEDITGYRISDWIGKDFSPMIPPSDLPRIQEIFRHEISGKSIQHEINVIKNDGTIAVLYANSTPILKEGKIVGILSFSRDITEQKKAEEELRRHREHLEEIVKERTSELKKKNEELEHFNRLFIGRELRMVALKRQIKQLEDEIRTLKGDR